MWTLLTATFRITSRKGLPRWINVVPTVILFLFIDYLAGFLFSIVSRGRVGAAGTFSSVMPEPRGKNEMSFFSAWLAVVTSELLFEIVRGESLFGSFGTMFLKRRCLKKIENVEDRRETSILDLPEFVLEQILGKLSAHSLCQASGVCREFRLRCRSDHVWKVLFQEKWGKLAGPAAYREWQRTLTSKNDACSGGEKHSKVWGWPLSCLWPFSWFGSQGDAGKGPIGPPSESLMAWYLALESGKLWFPAQIYNRENGHVGFMLSCYDAEVRYDRLTDTFSARYPPHGPRAIVVEECVPWSRLRAPPVDTSAHELHASDCLEELRPGDHVEVQWRRNKEFPYGWWYGVVGHTDNCFRDARHCRCHSEDTVWLEFKQYTEGSRWRQAAVDRKSHREEGNEAEGFYGGVRKLRSKEEINIWTKLWPTQALE
ncbi:hypothetical protein R1sor_017633 [Riccia sorocarpa]|uniref:F-box domain-containing protein n=1 Tax=Riccia sorocarpa TaxID=122646 RepID=A0ABD3IBE1_9MARC